MLVWSDSHARMGILAIEKQPTKRPLLDARNGRGVPMEMARSHQHQDEVCLSFRCFHEDITILIAISQGANVLKSHELARNGLGYAEECQEAKVLLCDAASKSTTSSALQRAMIAHRIARVGNGLTASLRLRRDLLVSLLDAPRMVLLMYSSLSPLWAAF